jgi:predicted transport protein
MLIVDGKRYKPWTPKDEEKEFHPLVKAQSNEIFGKDTIYFDVKTTLRTSSGVGSIPDAYVVDFDRSEWFVVENELSTHPVYNHIIPQLNKFMKGIENANVRNQILDLLYDKINSDMALRSVISKITDSTDIHNSLSKIIVHKSPRIVVIIDKKTEEVEEAFENFKVAPNIVEFRTFEQESNTGVYAHLFEPLYFETTCNRENASDNGTIEDIIEHIEPQKDIEALFRNFIQDIERQSNGFSRKTVKTRILYKTKIPFVGVELKRSNILLHLTLLNKPRNATFSRKVYRNRWHCHLPVRNLSEAESAMELCKKAYEESLH